MAGIGILFRRLDPYHSFAGWARVYGTAALISSGPWLLSILGVLFVGLITVGSVDDPFEVAEFQVSVTYLFASSLLLTGPLQFLLTRYVADRLFEKRRDAVVPAVMGAVLLTTVGAGVIGGVTVVLTFSDTSVTYRALFLTGLVILSDLWVVVILLTGLKAYRLVVSSFALAYAVVVIGGWLLEDLGVEGLLGAFVLGQALLLFVVLTAIVRQYESDTLVGFDFLDRRRVFVDLAWTGFFYNLAVWVDKAIFWFHPDTGARIVGPLRSCFLYDVPIFLAYLTIVPGLSVFLVRVETDFAEQYDEFYDLVRGGAPLAEIERTRDRLIETVRQGIYEILKVQGITLALSFLLAPSVLDVLGISSRYVPLFYVDAIGVAAQVLFLAILNVLFYLDQRRIALRICATFALSNLGLTIVTHQFGPSWYGYGFTLAAIGVVLVGLAALSQRLQHIVRETFMLQSSTR